MRAAAGDAADAAAEGCERRLLEATEADLLGDAGDEAVADGEGGFRSDVALGEARAAGGQHEGGTLRSVAQRGERADRARQG